MRKVIGIVSIVIAFVFLVLTPREPLAAACAANQGQLEGLVNSLNQDSRWSRHIEGKWSKNPNGSGWHMIYHNNKIVFATQHPVFKTRDAQYIQVCPSSNGADIAVVGKIFGSQREIEVKLQGDDLEILNGPTKGLFKKRNKSKQQILNEFANELRSL